MGAATLRVLLICLVVKPGGLVLTSPPAGPPPSADDDEGPRRRSLPREQPDEDCPTGTNQSYLNSFLWTIKRDPPSYFFGTIHVPYTEVWDFISENTKDAFDRSEMVFFELDLTDPFTISALANCQLLPQGEYLSNILPRDLYRRLKRHLDYVKLQMPLWMTADQRGRGLYADYLFNAIAGNWQRKRPVWVMLMVNSLTENDIKSRGVPVLDLYLAQEAEQSEKETGAVEEVDEQCVPLNELNFSQVLFALNQTLQQHENYRYGGSSTPYTTDDLIRHYNCGDLNTVIFSHDTAQVPNLLNVTLPPQDFLTAQHIDDYFREELIYKRNIRMAERVAQLLHTHPNKSFFFAFGAGHFLGNGTVIDHLEKNGFEVDYVTSDEEVFLGENWKKRPRSSFDSRDDEDSDEDRRRHRHRHRQRGRRKGRRKDDRTIVPDSHKIKQPSFNDLWVRLESTSSFGPNSYLAQQNLQIQQSVRPTTQPSPHSSSSSSHLTSSSLLVVSAIWLHHISIWWQSLAYILTAICQQHHSCS